MVLQKSWAKALLLSYSMNPTLKGRVITIWAKALIFCYSVNPTLKDGVISGLAKFRNYCCLSIAALRDEVLSTRAKARFSFILLNPELLVRRRYGGGKHGVSKIILQEKVIQLPPHLCWGFRRTSKHGL